MQLLQHLQDHSSVFARCLHKIHLRHKAILLLTSLGGAPNACMTRTTQSVKIVLIRQTLKGDFKRKAQQSKTPLSGSFCYVQQWTECFGRTKPGYCTGPKDTEWLKGFEENRRWPKPRAASPPGSLSTRSEDNDGLTSCCRHRCHRDRRHGHSHHHRHCGVREVASDELR